MFLGKLEKEGPLRSWVKSVGTKRKSEGFAVDAISAKEKRVELPTALNRLVRSVISACLVCRILENKLFEGILTFLFGFPLESISS